MRDQSSDTTTNADLWRLRDYDDPLAKYWPEFAQAGKERVTVRHLCHQAGLYGIRGLVDDDQKESLATSAVGAIGEGTAPKTGETQERCQPCLC